MSHYRGLVGTRKPFIVLRKSRPWLQAHSYAITRAVLAPLETVYKKSYKGQDDLPHFKSRYDSEPSIPLVTGTFKLRREWLHVQKIGQVRLAGHNPYSEGTTVSGTLKYEAGQWYAYLAYAVEVPKALVPGEIQAVGLDQNIRRVATSDGVTYIKPNTLRLEARRRYQRITSRRDAGRRKVKCPPSHRYLRAKTLYQGAHKRLLHARTNGCHKVSRDWANRYGIIYLEDLNVKGMIASAKRTIGEPGKEVVQEAGLNKAILDTGRPKLEQCLSYQMQVGKVPALYTSQRCYVCGHTKRLNRTTQNNFTCRECGYRTSADMNAALNTWAFGNGAAGRGGDEVTPACEASNGYEGSVKAQVYNSLIRRPTATW